MRNISVFNRIMKGHKPTPKDLKTVTDPVWKRMGINPSYGKKTILFTGTTKQLKREGISEEYSGKSYPIQKNLSKPMIVINKERKPETIIRTIGHETGHVVLKNATRLRVGKREAERRAYIAERVFVRAFNEEYGTKIRVTKRKSDLKMLRSYLKPRYKRPV